jgi:hypothetical protein
MEHSNLMTHCHSAVLFFLVARCVIVVLFLLMARYDNMVHYPANGSFGGTGTLLDD